LRNQKKDPTAVEITLRITVHRIMPAREAYAIERESARE
jgi:hypothetical protein